MFTIKLYQADKVLITEKRKTLKMANILAEGWQNQSKRNDAVISKGSVEVIAEEHDYQ